MGCLRTSTLTLAVTNSNHPPCPYPSNPTPSNNPSILGPRPDQAYAAGFTPTDIQQALYTMSLQQPDPTGYMATSATGNYTTPQGPQDQGSHP
ncbi:hypothetical protein HanXRQr2_Chr07g0288581 [Helianthus annuus]|uniref:Uncharacterized protein n=1 Tax=Helianthus annuus TaxID=4232 RepID=A0A251TGW1_HELAN|nr:hypothetical protein HanXRQr2_Chr07g0288581 [Helianthus annuus]KAJ0904214.1 hypothetical protein HanPSC8_Chr07g0279421 [Helianthus annuus]